MLSGEEFASKSLRLRTKNLPKDIQALARADFDKANNNISYQKATKDNTTTKSSGAGSTSAIVAAAAIGAAAGIVTLSGSNNAKANKGSSEDDIRDYMENVNIPDDMKDNVVTDMLDSDWRVPASSGGGSSTYTPMADPAVQSITAGGGNSNYTPMADPAVTSWSVSNPTPTVNEYSSSYYDGYGEYWKDKLEEEKNEYTWNALPGGYVFEEPHKVESDFNPLDGMTVIVGAEGGVVPFSGVSTDVCILFDSKGKVAITNGGSGKYGIPSAGANLKFGVSTADDYRDLLGDYYSIGGSGSALVSVGGELALGVSDGKLRNITLSFDPGVGFTPTIGEGHFSVGSSDLLWEGTSDEFWELVGDNTIDAWTEWTKSEYYKDIDYGSYS